MEFLCTVIGCVNRKFYRENGSPLGELKSSCVTLRRRKHRLKLRPTKHGNLRSIGLGTRRRFFTEPLVLVVNLEFGVKLLGQGFNGIFGWTAFCGQEKFGALRGPKRHQIEDAGGIGHLTALVDRHLCIIFPHRLYDNIGWPRMEAVRIGDGDGSGKDFCGHFRPLRTSVPQRHERANPSFQWPFSLTRIALFL